MNMTPQKSSAQEVLVAKALLKSVLPFKQEDLPIALRNMDISATLAMLLELNLEQSARPLVLESELEEA